MFAISLPEHIQEKTSIKRSYQAEIACRAVQPWNANEQMPGQYEMRCRKTKRTGMVWRRRIFSRPSTPTQSRLTMRANRTVQSTPFHPSSLTQRFLDMNYEKKVV
ncbi:unnamed protein product [Haemonchus placei]|uniref:Uncharacterized protein n=1 Tax=Haemonchus placei TaxID=6290 RepID=A0A0N4WJY2_HAEPC|nr:unnamed protein product [Haemonchus placei]